MCRVLVGFMALSIGVLDVTRADEATEARVILDRAIAAHGGEAALGKFVAMYFKVKGSEFDGDMKTPLSFEWFLQGNDKETAISYDENDKVTDVEVVNGKEGWTKDASRVTEPMSKEQVDSQREMIYLNWATMFVPLKAEGFRLSPLDETEVAGRKAVGILVSHDKHGPLKMYFDKETHLLVKYQRKFKNADVGRDIDEECVFSDYRTVQETKQAFKFETSWDGVKTNEGRVVEMKLYDKPLDEKLFVKP